MRLRESHPSFPWFSDGFPFWFPPFLAPSRPRPRISLGIYRSQSFFVTYGAPKANPPHPHTILENWVHPIRSSVPPAFFVAPLDILTGPAFSCLYYLCLNRPRTPLHSLSTYTLLNCHSFTHRARYIVVCFLIRFTDDSHQPPPNPTLISHTSIRHWSLSRASPPLPWPAS